jgi:seryl-tRNA synthetase
MLDIKFIRENPDRVKKAMKERKCDADVDRLLELDDRRRELIGQVEAKRAEQNTVGSRIAQEKDADAKQKAIEEMSELKKVMKESEEELNGVKDEYEAILLDMPNVHFEDVPFGKDESENVVLRQVGEPPKFDFEPKDHFELGEKLGVIDSERAAEVTGSRFTYLKGDLALLQYAVANYVMGILTDREALRAIIDKAGLDVPDTPFIPVVPPLMIRPEIFARMARLEPKEERYHIPSDDLYLIGSAEHTLGPLHMDDMLKEGDLPLRYVALTAAFRRDSSIRWKSNHSLFRKSHAMSRISSWLYRSMYCRRSGCRIR